MINKLKKTALVASTLVGTLLGYAAPSQAQDFYDGVSGPKATQMDVRGNLSDGKADGMFTPKLFLGKIDKSLPNLLFAVPFSISENGVKNVGFNVGYLAENLLGNGIVAAVGLFKDDQGKYRVINLQLYVTREHGPVSIDLEGHLPIHRDNGVSGQGASLTVGIGNSRIRGGLSGITASGEKPKLQGLIRGDITADHSYWVEGYFNPDQISVRLVINR